MNVMFRITSPPSGWLERGFDGHDEATIGQLLRDEPILEQVGTTFGLWVKRGSSWQEGEDEPRECGEDGFFRAATWTKVRDGDFVELRRPSRSGG